jgi:cytoskeleton protein RodZ
MTLTIGETLKNRRIEKKLSLEQIAAGTNIRIQYLQAIEEDRLQVMASSVQARGFVRLYASYLGINPLTLFNDEPKSIISESPQDVVKGVPEVTPAIPEKPARKNKPPSKAKTLEVTGTAPLASRRKRPETIATESGGIFLEIGRTLKHQRESLGLSLLDVERQIKIREIYLNALEEGRINDLPSTVQGRGMLNNYAAFMNLNPEGLQNRFAEGIQQRRVERKAEEETEIAKTPIRKFSSPVTGWRRYLTPDLLIGGGVFIVLFVLVIWGALQVIGSSRAQQVPTISSISTVLAGETVTPTLTGNPEASTTASDLSGTPEIVNTASVDLLATITSVSSGPIQVVIVAYQRAYLEVSTDGKEVFNGRIVPGNIYTYTGSQKVSLITGNAAAIQIYYNTQDLGILGITGQVLALEFTTKGFVTPTSQFTATPTITKPATLTPQPTLTPTPTLKVPTATVTPLVPTLNP